MSNFQNSDYVLNKHSGAIIYRFANKVIAITLSDYLAENPGKTADDFRKLKEISDADYLECDRADYRQSWKNISLDALGDSVPCPAPLPETTVIDMPDEASRNKRRASLGKKVFSKLTAIQQRRYKLYHVNELTTREIADIEGVSHVAVVYSLEAAESKIKKLLSMQ